MDTPGQVPGQHPGPFDWADYVAWLVQELGSLAAVASKLAGERGHTEEVFSVERALRRLRGRGARDGGSWGARCLRTFGVPEDVVARLRFMGHYHTRFADLPVSLCRELLRPWDRPPISESTARAFVQLGLASVALRCRDNEEARRCLARAEAVATGAARAEAHLVRAFLDPDSAAGLLDQAEALITALPEGEDRACLVARLVDQRGYVHNVVRRDPEAARACYEALPETGPPFAMVRRHNGLGYSALALGERELAVWHAQQSVQHAGDGGALRLRVMALSLLGKALGGSDGEAAFARARAIAQRLEDEQLVWRLHTARSWV